MLPAPRPLMRPAFVRQLLSGNLPVGAEVRYGDQPTLLVLERDGSFVAADPTGDLRGATRPEELPLSLLAELVHNPVAPTAVDGLRARIAASKSQVQRGGVRR